MSLRSKNAVFIFSPKMTIWDERKDILQYLTVPKRSADLAVSSNFTKLSMFVNFGVEEY